MNKTKTIITICSGVSLLAFSLCVSLIGQNKTLSSVDATEYELILNNTKRISNETSSYSLEHETELTTGNGNQLSLKASNVLLYNDGWQTIMPNGYFYNPVTNNGNNNKISGIQSITYMSNSNNSLALYYGYSINNTEIIYSLKEELAANTEYVFSNNHPSYIYIENNSGSAININSLSIKYSCVSESYPYQNLNILMIGNSFADDTIFYAARVASSYGINLNIYNSYIASCTIDQHYNNLLSGSSTYSMRSMNDSEWDYENNVTLEYILNSHHWDVISFQQASSGVGRSSTYSNLDNLVNEVKLTIGYTPRFIWNLTWAYDHDYCDSYDYFSYFNNNQLSMYDALIDCYETEVEPLNIFERIIPAGTAVQNMRTSYMKDTFTRDGKHMSSVHGRYLLALDFLSSFYGIDLLKSPCNYWPNEINNSFKPVIVESVQNAVKSPLSITNSVYTTSEIGAYDLTGYTEIDAGLVGCSYWNSTDGSNYNKRFQNSSGASNLYVSTNRFTSSTLPVGSIVAIDEGFGVRPEAWTSDTAQSSRPDETYQNVIEITSDFWTGYQYRAFNIFKAGKTTLLGQYDQIFDGFHIYVPNASLGDLKTKESNDAYSSDKAILKSQHINIDSFERLHLDPIIGFYKCDSYYDLTNSYVDDTAKKFVCTRPFYGADGDLPENTIIIVDSGYQWRSDCWGNYGSYSPRPDNVSTPVTMLDSSFWNGFRRRTFNVSASPLSYVGQNAIAFMNHMRIYVPTTDDIYLPVQDTVTMTALGYATLSSMAASVYGKADIPILITLHGDDVNKVEVKADGSLVSAPEYVFNKTTGSLSIQTTGDAGGYSYGTITGVVNRDAGTISNIAVTGSIKSYLTNNGSITANEMYFDRCNYSTNAASQNVWQRWYMSGSWQANSGTGEWTTSSTSYLLDNEHSMGLRIANSSYVKTKFTLKNDFNGGSGITPHGISIWIYNPNGDIYENFRIFMYKTASTTSNGHAVTGASYDTVINRDSIASGEWINIKTGLDGTTYYNIALYFETHSSSTTYLYLGHVSFY